MTSWRREKFEKKKWLGRLRWSKKGAVKGDNGRVLVIGGSSLFHAAPFWTANAASRIVDMVHFSSPYLLNNKLVEEKVKRGFWNGIVVGWEKVEKYVEEDEVVVIGPGMMRGRGWEREVVEDLQEVRTDETKAIVGYLLQHYPEKKWVVDGGALQEVEIDWLGEGMIITPNRREMGMLLERLGEKEEETGVARLVREKGVVVVVKGEVDRVWGWENGEVVEVEVEGGSAGMTKGGTGDVLAGIVAGLYAQNKDMVAGVVGSYLNKKAGEKLAREQVWFNASDLVDIDGKIYDKMVGR